MLHDISGTSGRNSSPCFFHWSIWNGWSSREHHVGRKVTTQDGTIDAKYVWRVSFKYIVALLVSVRLVKNERLCWIAIAKLQLKALSSWSIQARKVLRFACSRITDFHTTIINLVGVQSLFSEQCWIGCWTTGQAWSHVGAENRPTLVLQGGVKVESRLGGWLLCAQLMKEKQKENTSIYTCKGTGPHK